MQIRQIDKGFISIICFYMTGRSPHYRLPYTYSCIRSWPAVSPGKSAIRARPIKAVTSLALKPATSRDLYGWPRGQKSAVMRPQ